jgi:hypothetical protein
LSQLPTPEQQAQSEWLNARFGHLPFVRNVLFDLGRPMPIDFVSEQDGENTFVWPRYQAEDELGTALRNKTAIRFNSPDQAGAFNAAIMKILQNMMARSARGQ